MRTRTRGMRVAALAGAGLLVTTAVTGRTLNELEIRSVGEGARIILDVDGDVLHKSFTLTNPDRIVLDLMGAENSVKVGTRTLPAGAVAQVRVAQFTMAPEPVTRIVAELRQPCTFNVQRADNKLVLSITPGAQTAAAPSGSPAVEDAAPQPAPDRAPPPPVTETNAVPPAPASHNSDPAAPASPEVASGSEPADAGSTPAAPPAPTVVFEAAPESPPHKPSRVDWTEDTQPDAGSSIRMQEGPGRRINLDLQQADIRTVLRTLADYSGHNIIASKDVEGTVTARIKDAPWEDALASILRSQGYGYVEEGGIIRVGVLEKIRNEELEEAAAARKREDLLPIRTEVVKVEFANAAELQKSLAEMLTQRGRLQVDARTNALIISDIQQKVDKIAEMARELDSRTPQVEIVSKLVDVSADDSQNLGIEWSVNNVSAAGVIGSGGVSAPTPGAIGNVRVGTVQSWAQLNMMLDALARSQRANIVSNPNITTVNNREAKILVGSKIPLIVADEAGNAITQLTTVGIQMRVIPHVNSDRTITLDLHPEVSELSSQATVQGGVIINTSEADTRVIVEDGETAIIGGLIRDVQSEVKSGIPVLQDIPGVGWLFRNTNRVKDKRELIIFVTPRLMETPAKPAPGQG
jgi:type IV pilus assembly protein PilQ